MIKENLFFDLDGTLVNTKEGIFNSFKYVFSHFNLKEPDEKTLSTFIGPPLHFSFCNHFGVDFVTADLYVEKYREFYNKDGIFQCELYDGIREMCESLSAKYTLFVTTSKPTCYAERILEKLKIIDYFKEISGSEKDKPDSSKSQVVNYVISKYNLNKKGCLLIGDTKFDGEGANETGIDFFAVSYGFGKTEEIEKFNPVRIFDNPIDIVNYFME